MVKWKQVINYEIEIIDNKESKNWYGYNDYSHHVDEGNKTPYNRVTSHVYFKCNPDSKVNLTRRIINLMLEDLEIENYVYQEVYNFVKDSNNDSINFSYPYINEIEPSVKIKNRVSGNMIIFTIDAININNKTELLSVIRDELYIQGIRVTE